MSCSGHKFCVQSQTVSHVNNRGGKCGDFGWSRSAVVFLNTNLSVLEEILVAGENTHTQITLSLKPKF